MSLSTLIKTIFFSTLAALLFIFITTTNTNAGTSNNIVGSAWSANIGWISLNNCTDPADSGTCTGPDYGVTALETAPGTLSGYGWSPNLGWVSFNADAVAGCESGFSQCAPYIDWVNPNGDGSANVKGWARVCSYYETGCSGNPATQSVLGGWDGWIALGDTDTASGPSWGVTVRPDGTFDGFAWGSEVLGWISFSGVRLDNAVTGMSVQVVANPKVIALGGTSTLTITATNINGASACTASWGAPLTMTQAGSTWSTTAVVSPTQQTTYVVTCQGPSGQASGQDTVSLINVTSFNAQCVQSSDPVPRFNWTTNNATSCTITRSGGSSAPVPATGSNYPATTLPVQSGSSSYTLQCVNGAAAASWGSQLVVSTCVPGFTISATPSPQAFTDGPGNTKVATFTIRVNPFNGFNSSVALDAIQISPALPPSRDIQFSPTTLMYSSGVYNEATMTVTVDAAEITTTTEYTITVEGVGGGVSDTADAVINANGRRRPLFREF